MSFPVVSTDSVAVTAVHLCHDLSHTIIC